MLMLCPLDRGSHASPDVSSIIAKSSFLKVGVHLVDNSQEHFRTSLTLYETVPHTFGHQVL